MEKTYKFVFKYSTNSTESELLEQFRLQVLKQPYLYSNNTFKKAKPIKKMPSFYEMHKYIQGFGFKDQNYPLYYTIALALYSSFYTKCFALNIGRINKDKYVTFIVTWNVLEGLNTYESLYKLPYDNKITWFDQLNDE